MESADKVPVCLAVSWAYTQAGCPHPWPDRLAITSPHPRNLEISPADRGSASEFRPGGNVKPGAGSVWVPFGGRRPQEATLTGRLHRRRARRPRQLPTSATMIDAKPDQQGRGAGRHQAVRFGTQYPAPEAGCPYRRALPPAAARAMLTRRCSGRSRATSAATWSTYAAVSQSADLLARRASAWRRACSSWVLASGIMMATVVQGRRRRFGAGTAPRVLASGHSVPRAIAAPGSAPYSSPNPPAALHAESEASRNPPKCGFGGNWTFRSFDKLRIRRL